jgi:hypothetical protein
MKKLLVLSLITITACLGQQQPPVTPTPPCVIPFFMAQGGGGAQSPVPLAGFDNRQSGCTNWDITYTSTGYTAVTLTVESAPTSDNTAPGTVGTWVTFAGTVVSGINPNTSITQAETTLTGYFPWIRVHLTASTTNSVGNIVGVLIGTVPINASGGSASAGGGTAVTVVGNPTLISGQQAVTAAAVALATNPIKNICLHALSTNTASIFLGPTATTIATGIELAPGDSNCLPLSNSNLVFVIAAAIGQTITWDATN